MYLIVTYDISDDRKRNKMAKSLLQFGIRTQKSFFECEVDKKELNIIKKIVKKYSDSSDFVTFYLPGKIERIGNVQYLEIDDIVI